MHGGRVVQSQVDAIQHVEGRPAGGVASFAVVFRVVVQGMVREIRTAGAEEDADTTTSSPFLPRAPPPPEEQERASANASSFAEVPLLPPAATCQQNSSGVIASAAATDITAGKQPN